VSVHTVAQEGCGFGPVWHVLGFCNLMIEKNLRVASNIELFILLCRGSLGPMEWIVLFGNILHYCTLLQIDYFLFHCTIQIDLRWTNSEKKIRSKMPLVLVHFKFLRICSIVSTPLGPLEQQITTSKNWHFPQTKSSNAFQSCKYT